MSYILDIIEKQDDELLKTLRVRAVPAWKHHDTGEIIKGKRGLTHQDMMPGAKVGNKAEADKADDKFSGEHDRGFYDPVSKKFHSGDDVELDSLELMTKQQRFRKFGVESKDKGNKVLE